MLAWIHDLVAQGAPSEIESFVTSTIEEAQVFVGATGPIILIVSLLVALWSGSRAIYAIQKALRLIEGVEQRRKYWQTRGLGILLTIGAGVALILAYIVLLFGGWVVEILGKLGIAVGQATTISSLVVALWVAAVLFAIYRWGIAVPIRRPLISATIVATLLMFATWVSALVVPTAANGTAAALGSMGIVLVWSYAVGFIIIVTPSIVTAVELVVRGPDS